MACLARGCIVKLVEWCPIPVLQGGRHVVLNRYSIKLITLSLILFVPLAGLGFYSAEWPIYLQLLPLFLSLFLFGIPHGGADHLLLWGMLRKDSWPKRITAFGSLHFNRLCLFYLLGFPTFSSSIIFPWINGFSLGSK